MMTSDENEFLDMSPYDFVPRTVDPFVRASVHRPSVTSFFFHEHIKIMDIDEMY